MRCKQVLSTQRNNSTQTNNGETIHILFSVALTPATFFFLLVPSLRIKFALRSTSESSVPSFFCRSGLSFATLVTPLLLASSFRPPVPLVRSSYCFPYSGATRGDPGVWRQGHVCCITHIESEFWDCKPTTHRYTHSHKPQDALYTLENR